MFRFIVSAVAILAAAGLTVSSGLAQQAPPVQTTPANQQERPFSFTNDVDVEFLPDGRLITTNRYRGKVLTQAGVQALGTFRDTYNEHYSAWEMVEAFTVKPDGRRVPVDRAKIIIQAAQASPDALHFFVDMKTATVIFPELEVGDSVEGVFRAAQKQAFLPGGASWGWSMPRYVRRSEATITLRAPKDLGLKVWQNGLEHREEIRGNEVAHVFRYTERPFASVQNDSISPMDFEPAVMATTFRDWQAVAKAFWDRGAGKSDPSPAVAAKAREITLGITDPRKKTEAVFNWVSEKVRYVNIVLGAGGWVPREADSILSNLFGDCKDHVTLMRAMLRALDIKADYALVNVQSLYKPYPLPMAWFDHIILFLPDLNIYIDPTNRHAQFGETDLRLQGKPVLRFNADSATFSVIPRVPAERNAWLAEVDLVVGPDGRITGRNALTTRHTGVPNLRSRAANLAEAGLETSATRALTSGNWRGKGVYAIPASPVRSDSFIIRSNFEINNDFRSRVNGGTRFPMGPMAAGRPNTRLANFLRDSAHSPFTCFPVRWEEKITVRLPEGSKLAEMPQGQNASVGKVRFQSTYALSGDTLTVQRLFVWDTDEVICTTASLAQYRPVLVAMGRDLNRNRLVVTGIGGAASAPGQSEGELE